MKNTEKYFHGVAGFIEDMTEINANHDKEDKRLEPFKGSDGYNKGMQEAQAQRDASVRQMRETYLKQFREVAAKMREAIAHRPLVPPTPEQAALLSVLSMRDTLTQDELTRAAEQMAGCQAALAVLDDLAAKNKARGVRFNRELAADDLRSRIDTLERASLELIQAGADAENKRVPKDEIECLSNFGCFAPAVKKDARIYGGVTSSDLETDVKTVEEFCKCVNG